MHLDPHACKGISRLFCREGAGMLSRIEQNGTAVSKEAIGDMLGERRLSKGGAVEKSTSPWQCQKTTRIQDASSCRHR